MPIRDVHLLIQSDALFEDDKPRFEQPDVTWAIAVLWRPDFGAMKEIISDAADHQQSLLRLREPRVRRRFLPFQMTVPQDLLPGRLGEEEIDGGTEVRISEATEMPVSLSGK